MNRDLNIKSTIRQILGVLISIMILMPFTVSSQTVTTTIDCANATTDINGNGYRWDLSNKILALDGIDLRTSQMMGIELPPNSTITLQGDNYIEGASRAILFNIGSTEQDPGGTLTIKGDGTLTLNSTNTPSAIFNNPQEQCMVGYHLGKNDQSFRFTSLQPQHKGGKFRSVLQLP